MAVYGYLESVGVAFRHNRQFKGQGGCTYARVVGLLVAEGDLEDGALIGRHIAYLALRDGYLRVFQARGGNAQQRAGLVEECGVGILPRAPAGTCQLAEDETAVSLQLLIFLATCSIKRIQ